jgi:hypothetical protein
LFFLRLFPIEIAQPKSELWKYTRVPTNHPQGPEPAAGDRRARESDVIVDGGLGPKDECVAIRKPQKLGDGPGFAVFSDHLSVRAGCDYNSLGIFG